MSIPDDENPDDYVNRRYHVANARKYACAKRRNE